MSYYIIYKMTSHEKKIFSNTMMKTTTKQRKVVREWFSRYLGITHTPTRQDAIDSGFSSLKEFYAYHKDIATDYFKKLRKDNKNKIKKIKLEKPKVTKVQYSFTVTFTVIKENGHEYDVEVDKILDGKHTQEELEEI